MLMGYMRVSSDNDRQTTDLQRDESAKIPGDSKANATLSATLGKNTRFP